MTLEVTPQVIKTICQPVQKHGRSHVASGPRKGHRKSRQGCVDCKRRKIKCQETLPACENCIRASLQCRYFTHTASGSTNISPHQPITLHETQIFNLTDMRLFHHYLVAAYPHLPVRNDDVWLVYITPIGHQFDFLMHALLALSASHLNKLTTSGLTNVAQAHRLAAIKGLNGVLDQPITTAEQGDAILATCYALLMQSWYMDDGLPAFLIMTRSCELVTRQIRSHDVGSILAEENSDSRIERMRTRLKGAPTFTVECIRASLESLNAIQPLCHQAFEQDFWTKLQDSFIALAQSPIEAYRSLLQMEKSLTELDSSEIEQLTDPCNTTTQLLMAHFVALHLMTRPICCRERKTHTVTMYGIRMDTWIGDILNQMKPEYQANLQWPLFVSQLHTVKRLESYTLVPEMQTDKAP